MMTQLSQQLKELVQSSRDRLLSIPDQAAGRKPYPDKWSLKEILGHLIDSAANNHQRIVRMQERQDIGSFQYAQKHWVTAQDYQTAPWAEIVEWWSSYNNHLAHVIGRVNPSTLDHVCDMGYSKPATLKFVMEDYLRHVRHHLEQIFGGADPMQREHWVARDPY
jgi:hypothetical protein